jgi:hypothetical protein
MVCVLQAMEDLTDRDAVGAVRVRLEWKYAPGLGLADPGFDFSVLSGFRGRLAVALRAMRRLEPMLEAAAVAGLLRAVAAGICFPHAAQALRMTRCIWRQHPETGGYRAARPWQRAKPDLRNAAPVRRS